MNYDATLLRHIIIFLTMEGDWRLDLRSLSLFLSVQKDRRDFDVKRMLRQELQCFEKIVVIHAVHCRAILDGINGFTIHKPTNFSSKYKLVSSSCLMEPA
ncbi:unnamed protein product [Cylicocyclus nassatus]|uniref:Uncharacterized protein n=1 Tax=Cylicocyclus nassatus TaxID=53992 RepID=A0AA36H501_CYLNA|nr:unnamed protein product [Cylicocyclus nassatus]